jgi:hypothetical protein
MAFLFRQTNLSLRQFFGVCVFILFVAGLAYMAATGRLHWLVAAGAAVLPLLRRLPLLLRAIPIFRQLSGYARSAGWTQRAGQSSRIQTRFLAMTLDHDTGGMDGEVLEGGYIGKLLSSLALSDLMILRETCQVDPDSMQVLEAWLDRCHAEWRQDSESAGQQQGNTFTSSSMTEQEALDILGLMPGAPKEKIVEAHRRLIQKLHPDHGGSTYLAAKLNEAKEYLVR